MTSPVDLLRPMFEDAIEMLSLTWASFHDRDPSGLETAAGLGHSIHKQEKDLTALLLATPPAETASLRFVPGHLERIGDAIDGLVRSLRTMAEEHIVFTDRGTREIDELFGKALELLECVRDLTLTRNRVLASHVELESMRLQERLSDFARAHEERLVDGVCLPRASSTYLAMLDAFREFIRHARRAGTRATEPPSPPARPRPER